MPENATFTICLGSDLCFFDGLSNGKILMIASKDLIGCGLLDIKANEILDDIQQTCPIKHTFIERIKLSKGRVFIAAILCFPLHEAIKAGSDRTGFVSCQIANNAYGVVVEDRRDVLHIIADLAIGIFSVDFVLGRALQLYQN